MANWGRNSGTNTTPAHNGAAYAGPSASDLTVGDYANGVPNIRIGDMLKSFMRQLPWMIPLFLLGAVGAWYLTKDLKTTYTGNARVMVQLGEEYVYQPVGVSSNSNGMTTTIDTITLTEAAIMSNDATINSVIGLMTSPSGSRTSEQAAARFDKKSFAKIRKAPTDAAREEAYRQLRKKVAKNYSVFPRAKSSIIDVSYKHQDPDVAIEATNAFVDAYLAYRREIFVEGRGDVISARRQTTEDQLNSNERAIAKFLKKNNISDFDSEQGGLRKRSEETKAVLNTTRASISEVEASLSRVEDQIRQTSETIDLYVDDRTAQRIAQTELELRQLLAKYLPNSNPVQQKRTELEELKSLQADSNGKAAGGRRVGPNPVFQALLTRRNNMAAQADSLREKEFTLQAQLNGAVGKVRRLTSLTPEYQNLLRERQTLNARLTSYNAKEQEALVDAEQAKAKAENVKVVSWARFAKKGRNMRTLMFLAGCMAWGLTLFFIAALRVFLDPRLYSATGGPASPGRSVQMAPAAPAPVYSPADTVPTYAPPEYAAAAYASSAAAYEAAPAYDMPPAAHEAPYGTQEAPAASDAGMPAYYVDQATGQVFFYETAQQQPPLYSAQLGDVPAQDIAQNQGVAPNPYATPA